VRSNPDAKTSPQMNATTIAAPKLAKLARECLLVIEHTYDEEKLTVAKLSVHIA
jgi:hypothetical protein